MLPENSESQHMGRFTQKRVRSVNPWSSFKWSSLARRGGQKNENSTFTFALFFTVLTNADPCEQTSRHVAFGPFRILQTFECSSVAPGLTHSDLTCWACDHSYWLTQHSLKVQSGFLSFVGPWKLRPCVSGLHGKKMKFIFSDGNFHQYKLYKMSHTKLDFETFIWFYLK